MSELPEAEEQPDVVIVPLTGVAPCRHVFGACGAGAGAEAGPAVRALLDAGA